MHFDVERGRYTPSFFKINIDTFQEFETLKDLPVEILSTFFHEYFHYIQDLTTVFGLDCAWNSFDRILRVLKYCQEKEAIEVPADIQDLDVLKDNHRILMSLMGYSNVKCDVAQNPDNFGIVNVSFSKNEYVSKKIDSTSYDIQLKLRTAQGEDGYFLFGGIAIIETMAALIQGKFFNTQNLPTFPYKVAIKLVEYLCPKVARNYEMVFALCDIALLSPTPGKSFYDILLSLEQSNFDPIIGEDIYRFGQLYYRKNGYHFEKKFGAAKEALINITGRLFGHDEFVDNKAWLHTILNSAFYYRVQNPQFMLALFRSSSPFSTSMATIYRLLGTPDIINLDFIKWIALPLTLNANPSKVNPVYLTALNQIHDSFLYGSKTCCLTDNCTKAKTGMPVNDDCYTKPWMKGQIRPLCPVGALLVAFGLDSKEFIS